MAEGLGSRVELDLSRRIWKVFSQKDNEEGHGDVAHALYVTAGWMSVVPDEKQSFEHLLDALTFADKLEV